MSFVASAVYSGQQADKGADAQVKSAEQMNKLAWRMYENSRNDSLPYYKAGRAGLSSLMQLAGFTRNGNDTWQAGTPDASLTRLMMDPGYQFRLNQGMDALQNSVAARGGLLSGNTLKAISNYGQDYASNEYGNAFNRLASLAGIGQAEAGNMAQQNNMLTDQVGQGYQMAGQARASGYAGKANAVNNMLDQQMKLVGMFMGQGG